MSESRLLMDVAEEVAMKIEFLKLPWMVLFEAPLSLCVIWQLTGIPYRTSVAAILPISWRHYRTMTKTLNRKSG